MRSSPIKTRLSAVLLPLAVLLFDRTASSTSPTGYYALTGTVTTGTALDTRTGLRWQRGFAAPGGSNSSTWAEANAACQALTLEGLAGWRLPTVRELESIFDVRHTGTDRPYDANVFAFSMALGGATLWSSTPLVADATKIQARSQFPLRYNQSNYAPLDKTDFAGAHCVRDPQ